MPFNTIEGSPQDDPNLLPSNQIIEASQKIVLSRGLTFRNSYDRVSDRYMITFTHGCVPDADLSGFLSRQGWLGFGTHWSFSGVFKRSRRKGPREIFYVPVVNPSIMA